MRKIRRPQHGEEWHIQRDLIAFLRARAWHVERMAGGPFQSGIPDIYSYHKKWGTRWIDVKRPGKNYSFTKAQKIKWPEWDRAGIGIWILTAATQEQYDLLFGPPNWRTFAKASWKISTQQELDTMIDRLANDETPSILFCLLPQTSETHL